MTFWWETEHFSGKNVALRWSISSGNKSIIYKCGRYKNLPVDSVIQGLTTEADGLCNLAGIREVWEGKKVSVHSRTQDWHNFSSKVVENGTPLNGCRQGVWSHARSQRKNVTSTRGAEKKPKTLRIKLMAIFLLKLREGKVEFKIIKTGRICNLHVLY